MESWCQHCQKAPATCFAVGMCVCEQCQVRLSASGLSGPSGIDLSQQAWRYCHRCQQVNYSSVATCAFCGFVEVELVPAPVVEETKSQVPALLPNSPNPYWTCVCGYEFNTTLECAYCKGVKPGTSQSAAGWQGQYQAAEFQGPSNPYPQYQGVPPPINAGYDYHCTPQPTQATQSPGFPAYERIWKCKYCARPDNEESSYKCAACQRMRYDQGEPWMCFECGVWSAFGSINCRNCKKDKMSWAEFLESKKVELSDDKSRWKCKLCKRFTPVSSYKCEVCGEVNKAAARGLQGKGKGTFKERTLDFIKDLF